MSRQAKFPLPVVPNFVLGSRKDTIMLNPLLHTSNSAPTSPVCGARIITTPCAAVSSSGGGSHVKKAVAKLRVIKTGQGGGISNGNFVSVRLQSHKPEANPHKNAMELSSLTNNRRLSRVVKCRTLELFTEFPEGMREYPRPKPVVRESRSQPNSPSSIPKIRVQDFGFGARFLTGDEVKENRPQ